MAAFLLVDDRSAQELIREERFSATAAALEARLRAEREFAGGPQMEIISAAAEWRAALQRTHGRYFLDLEQLVERLLQATSPSPPPV
jgi:5'-deoxynucleotidase YfbR-like HD superfamily hydrolase